MDFLKKAAAAASSSGDKNANNENQAPPQQQQQQQQQQGGDNKQDQNQNQQSGDQQDYGDKAFDMINKKAGLNLSRDNQEIITDGARGAYEKFSGCVFASMLLLLRRSSWINVSEDPSADRASSYSKQVDAKYSN
ncbi:hypothetical protein E4U42_002525 [Claviceps africana]|uniref:Uncharacterized protein n=1 Tax=Claviceps africana TaxID=83212 RepID=A0A8K0J837_9HYPO|nr:hypothetical protein E4U42_002525 [Claviceps africana]